MTEDVIRLREELSEQIRSLSELKQMAKPMAMISPSLQRIANEAVQWLYFAYLGGD